MGGWNDTILGLKVKKNQEQLAQQLLRCLGADPDDYGCEEVGRLNELYDPSVEGLVKGGVLGMMPPLNQHFSNYLDQFYGSYYGDEYDDEYEDEEGEEEENEAESADEPDFGFTLDALFHLANQLFSSATVCLAHEDGNNTSDDYYRHEVILDPATGKKTISDCFYSYGEGINVDTDDPEEEGTETHVEDIEACTADTQVIQWLIDKATSYQYDELVQKLGKCK